MSPVTTTKYKAKCMIELGLDASIVPQGGKVYIERISQFGDGNFVVVTGDIYINSELTGEEDYISLEIFEKFFEEV